MLWSGTITHSWRVYSFSSAGLLCLWQRVVQRPRSKGGDKLARLVQKLMRQRHHLRVKREYVVTVPFHRGHRTKQRIKNLVVWGLAHQRVPPEWICEIRRRTRIVFSQRPSVGRMLDNHRRFADKFDLAKPFACVCQSHPIREHWRGERPPPAHVQYLLSECVDPILRRVSEVGSGYIPVPHATLTAEEILTAADGFGRSVFQDGRQFCDGWGAEGRRRLLAIVQGTALAGDPATGRFVSCRDVQHVKRLVSGLVVGPVDRNVKDRLIECPAVYWDGYKRTFWTDHHREKAPADGGETQDDILCRWRQAYVDAGWKRYAPLLTPARQAIPGVAYTMVKMKDLAASSPHVACPRRRPLTPYGGRGRHSKGHPMRQLMRMCGAVLQAGMAAAQLRCWHLPAATGFAQRMDEIRLSLASVGAGEAGRAVRVFPFDVKAMFTELSKAAVLDAVTWVLEHNPGWAPLPGGRGRYPRGAWVSSALGDHLSARVGAGLRGRAGEKFVPLAVVLAVVKFDLRESVMRCGQHLLWQVHGIPMGSYLSAILAGLTVAVAEHRFYGRLPAEVASRVEGVRYADDGVVAIVEWRGVDSAETVFQRFVDECYPAPLQLEVEQHDGQFDLLETTVRVFPDGNGWVMHKSKDWSQVQLGRRRRFRVWTGGDSWSGAKRGVLVGTLLRADANCSHRLEVLPLRVRALLRVLVEAQVWGGYSMSAIRRTLGYLAAPPAGHPRPPGVWPLLRKAIAGGPSMCALYAGFCRSASALWRVPVSAVL